MGFFDTLLGKDSADASKKAAADTYYKQQNAGIALRGAGNDYLSGMMDQSQRYDPYIQGGNSAYQKLLQGLGLGGESGSQAFAQGYQNLPGYKEGLNTGTQAVTSRLNAGPGMQSGAAMKALQRYGSDYENQRSGDYLQRLMALGTQGLGATQASVGTAAQGYGGQLQARTGAANMDYGSAGTIGQGDIAAAQARSQGLMNTINLGMQGAGMLMGMPSGGGFGSSFGSGAGGGLPGGGSGSPWGASFQHGQWIPTV
jgi:hypothetical protein